jgi:hypothetical protein
VVVKRLPGIAALIIIMCSSAVVGYAGAAPAKWVGTWVLSVSESKIRPFLMPGVPLDLAILGQTLRLEKTAKAIRLSGETTFRVSGEKHSGHDDTSLDLDGTETVFGPVSLSVRLVDDSTFEILSKVKPSNPNLVEVSRFSVSSDGAKLTETKTQTEREVVPEDANKAGAVIRVVTSVLVFGKQP